MSRRRADRRIAEGLECVLGHRFKDRSLLDTALTHRSILPEGHGAGRESYERFEFLGDALLGFLVAEGLLAEDPEADEGILTRRRQELVSTATLADVARVLGIGEALRLGRGEESGGGRSNPSLLADAFESVLAAVYRDGGIRAARGFVRRHLGDRIRDSSGARGGLRDSKTRLQERTQALWRRTPYYRLAETSGPPHARRFLAEVLVGDDVLGSGVGSTRKQAEQEAARKALEMLPSVQGD
jgi:ribonuclease III